MLARYLTLPVALATSLKPEMVMQAVIRRAIAPDLAALNELMRQSSAYRGKYSAILEGYSVTPEQLATDDVYVLEEARKILGFYSLINIASSPELDLMFVADESQGKQIGATLFAHMKQKAVSLGANEVKIVSHPPAEAFYVRMGAEKVGVKAPSGRVTWERPILLLRVAWTGRSSGPL